MLSPADVLAQAVPDTVYSGYGEVLNSMVTCVYPMDGYTGDGTRNFYGCDFQNTGIGGPVILGPWGSRDNTLGYSTVGQWESHYSRVGNQQWRQCSWSADNPQWWRNMIASHNADFQQSSWNEVMLYNWGHHHEQTVFNNIMRRWIVAYFYDPNNSSANGLSVAQSFQSKTYATGRKVAILRLDFTKPAAQRFEFRQADQVSGMYP